MAFVQAANTTGLVWRNGQADTVQLDGHDALLRALVTFAAGKASLSVSYAGTGNGLINFLDGGVAAPTETWTIAFTTATDFTVSGSVSGAQAGGSTGSLYTTSGDPLTSLLSFQIDVGGTAFIATDTFTVLATVTSVPAADRWVLDRWNPDDLNGLSTAMIWHGLGDGTEAIHTGIRRIETPASQIWNWRMRNYTGFASGRDWNTQPGVSPDLFTAFWDNDMLYWFQVDSRRYTVAAKVSTTFHALYQGFFLPFGSPTEYPFPSVLIGEKDDSEAHTSTATDFGFVTEPIINGTLRQVDGVWVNAGDSPTVGNFWLWPASTAFGGAGSIWENHENFDSGDHQLMPILLGQGPTGGATEPLTAEVFGVLDGVNIVTGFGNSSETILSIGGTDWVVFQDIFRTSRENFWAMEMV